MSKSTPPEVEIRARELLACPFCGNKNIQLLDNGIGDVYAVCASDDPSDYACGAQCPSGSCETDEKAIRLWNTRVTPQDDVVEKRIVEWLRAQDFVGASARYQARRFADRIERGEHLEAIRVGGGM